MAGNSIGTIFRLTTFGESHGSMIGGVIEGCPSGLPVDLEYIQQELSKRSPGRNRMSSQRKEEDHVEIVSGLRNGKTLGSPIAFFIRNKDARPEDYKDLENVYRPSHADYTTEVKYGTREAKGGGRMSGRETAARVAGGAFARLLLREAGMGITAFTSQIGPYKLDGPLEEIGLEQAGLPPLFCPDPALSEQMIAYLEELRSKGDTTGGTVTCRISHVPAGLGEPVFDKLHADLGKAVLSIGACKGFEIGSGFSSVAMKGSDHNDAFTLEKNRIVTRTNHSGGVQGGISNGMDIWFRAAFKPVPSINLEQETIDNSGETRKLRIKGRHDVCVIPRVIPVVEAMTALVMADHWLRRRSSRI